MRINKNHLKLKLFLIMVFLFLAITVISTSCVFSPFSLLGKFTGIEVRIGKNIDQDLVASELIYPDSMALVQADGNIKRIMELASQYGAALSEKEFAVLDELPQEIKEQELNATIYSTADDKVEVLGYYDSFDNKRWDIQKSQSEEQVENTGQPAMLVASKEDEQQMFMLIGTQNNTFIIFIGFDWEVLSEKIEK
ncbi:MAG: hypothetical protein HQ569_01790 [Actinobacteria bacterium]|nr:hypothetical protein [Actinomycetota bacterium]